MSHDDDDEKFVEAALRDVNLAASLLMNYAMGGRMTESASPSTAVSELHRGMGNWGCRRWRSRGTGKEGTTLTKADDVNRGSPTTPLTWSGVSGSSDEEQVWGGSSAGQQKRGRGEETAFLSLEPGKEIAIGEPVKLRLGSDSASPAGIRRTGKKKSLSELKAMEESLLRDRAHLQKMVEEQKKILADLQEENLKMNQLKMNSSEGAQRERGFLIDLNSVPDDDDH